MKKSFILGLVTLLGFSSTAFAASTSLSTTGSWQTATGTLSGLQGQSAPATWTYDTDLSAATYFGSSDLLSGGTGSYYKFNAPSYTLSDTAGPDIFDGKSFGVDVIDNTIAAIDASYDTDLLASMLANGLDPSATGDVLNFYVETDYQGKEYMLDGLMIFEESFFSGSIFTLPPAETLLQNAIFTYATLSVYELGPIGVINEGGASYAQSHSAVPIPAAVFLFAPALLGFLGLRRKTKSAVI